MFVGIKNKARDQKDIGLLADEEIIMFYKNGYEEKYLKELFQRYTHLAFGICLKYLKDKDDAKDATMEILEDLIDDLKTHPINNFKSWFYTVAKNHCLMKIRKVNRHPEGSLDDVKIFPEHLVELSPENHLIEEENTNTDLQALNKAVENLDDKQRTCIELMYLQDKSYKEIVDLTGYDMNKVKSHIQNGKRNLKLLLTKEAERKDHV